MSTLNTIKRLIGEIKEPYEIMLLDRYLKETLGNLGVSKSKGNPVGEYAEHLAALAFSGTRMSNTKTGHDLTLANGDKIEVKGRIFEGDRVPKTTIYHSTVIRKTFDYLIYIVFKEDMSIKYAMKISLKDFTEIAKYVEHNNDAPKWIFKAKPTLLNLPNVVDITNDIRKAQIEVHR